MNSYDLSRNWFDWTFENPEKINTNHTALYFFIIEHCNRLGWKSKFGLPTTMAKEAIGIRSYNTYIKTLNDLCDFGFVKIIEKSKNQYSSNIIALSNFNKAHDKALDKALIKHTIKQVKSTSQSIDSIDKQETINNKQINNKPIIDIEIRKKDFANSIQPFISKYNRDMLNEFFAYWTEPTQNKNPKMRFELEKTWSVEKRLATWSKNELKFKQPNYERTKPQTAEERMAETLRKAMGYDK